MNLSQEKILEIESNDQFNIKEKFKISFLESGVVLSMIEFSKDSDYENSISMTLTKKEFSELMELAKKVLVL